jgi:hypothetical protein
LGETIPLNSRIVYVPWCVAVGEPHTEACDCPEFTKQQVSTLPPEFQQDEATLYMALRMLSPGMTRVRATVALENLVAEITEKNSGSTS